MSRLRSVQRLNVGPRVVLRRLADGEVACAEGVEYLADCGCVLVFGLRLDTGEKSMGYTPCSDHDATAHAFLHRFCDKDGQEIETATWFALVLDDTEAHL